MSLPEIEKNSSSGTQPSAQRSLISYTVVALGLALFVRFFVASPYVVIGASMEPNFDNYHYLIIDRVTYRFFEPVRGDVIVLDLPQETSRALIKRVIGLPGDTIVLSGQNVTVINTQYPDGLKLSEPYLDPKNLGGVNELRVTLGKDEYFVLGDNRRVSSDSRIWGTLPRNDIVGRVFARLYPFGKIGLFPNEARYTQ
ncbi:MAG: hypothetical protein RLZZ416_640 [Candidatus Parcubacteria bacterium]|jgi:signal peptidase I